MDYLNEYISELQTLRYRNKLLWRERNMKNPKDYTYSYTATQTLTPSSVYDKTSLDNVDNILANHVITDFRPPEVGEVFAAAPDLFPFNCYTTSNSDQPRFILREKNWRDATFTAILPSSGRVEDITPRDIYSPEVLNRGIPDGYVFVRFGIPRDGDYFLSYSGAVHPNTGCSGFFDDRNQPAYNRLRVILRKTWRDETYDDGTKVTTVKDVYPESVLQKGIPKGWKFVGFRKHKFGEFYLTVSGIVAEARIPYYSTPSIILEPPKLHPDFAQIAKLPLSERCIAYSLYGEALSRPLPDLSKSPEAVSLRPATRWAYSGFRTPQRGDFFVSTTGFGVRRSCFGNPNIEDNFRIIVEPTNNPRRVLTFKETGEVRQLKEGEFGAFLNMNAPVSGPYPLEIPVYTLKETWEDVD